MQYIIMALIICSAQTILSAPIASGKAFFQNQNIDAITGQPDATYYPQLAAPNRVSVTTTAQNPDAPAEDKLHEFRNSSHNRFSGAHRVSQGEVGHAFTANTVLDSKALLLEESSNLGEFNMLPVLI